MNALAHPNFSPIADEQRAKSIEAFPRLQTHAERPSPRVALRVKGRILFINLGDVVAVQAEGNYVLLQRDSSSFLLRESISAVAEKLEPYGFIRIHRSALVNPSFVEEIRPYSTGEYGLRVKGGKEYTVTRTYKKNLNSLAEFWIGAGALHPNRERVRDLDRG
jgi:DNA-binding LytR/AlgR family response regulator